MKDLLGDKDQWIVVDSSTPPKGTSIKDWEKLEWKVKNTILLYLSYLVLLNVLGEDITKALWNMLGDLYHFKSLVNKL
jgi:hypothetical protein